LSRRRVGSATTGSRLDRSRQEAFFTTTSPIALFTTKLDRSPGGSQQDATFCGHETTAPSSRTIPTSEAWHNLCSGTARRACNRLSRTKGTRRTLAVPARYARTTAGRDEERPHARTYGTATDQGESDDLFPVSCLVFGDETRWRTGLPRAANPGPRMARSMPVL